MEVAFGITGAGKPFNCASAIKNWFDSTMKAGFACAWMIHAVQKGGAGRWQALRQYAATLLNSCKTGRMGPAFFSGNLAGFSPFLRCSALKSARLPKAARAFPARANLCFENENLWQP
ncbi:MAG: hypothetical protein KA372_13550, partial [Dokdonella sp.]|nr:hypothetical protein [Dokdonella sp.]